MPSRSSSDTRDKETASGLHEDDVGILEKVQGAALKYIHISTKRQITRVLLSVCPELVFRLESKFTVLTLEWLLSSMPPHVNFQILLRLKPFWAVFLFAGKSVGVRELKKRGERNVSKLLQEKKKKKTRNMMHTQ